MRSRLRAPFAQPYRKLSSPPFFLCLARGLPSPTERDPRAPVLLRSQPPSPTRSRRARRQLRWPRGKERVPGVTSSAARTRTKTGAIHAFRLAPMKPIISMMRLGRSQVEALSSEAKLVLSIFAHRLHRAPTFDNPPRFREPRPRDTSQLRKSSCPSRCATAVRPRPATRPDDLAASRRRGAAPATR